MDKESLMSEHARTKCYFLTEPFGILCILFVYALMAAIYSLTIMFALAEDLKEAEGSAYANLIFFTIFSLLALYSHFQCVKTNPGVLPREYEQIDDHNLPRQFGKLLRERESMHEAMEKRKAERQREGSVNTKDEAGVSNSNKKQKYN